jgi:ZIP family zinc transporter
MEFGGSFGWGLLAGSSLVVGALIAFAIHIPLRVIGLIMGFGAGVLISAVAFDLVDEAVEVSTGTGWAAAGLFAGCLVFYAGDRMIERLGGGDRENPEGVEEEGEGGSPLSIVLGTVLDGIPESMVIGLAIYEGGAVGAAYLAAVFISNVPESISATSGLLASGWKKSRVLWMWIGIAVISGLSSLAGYTLFQDASPDVNAFILTFAAGAILTMLADTMMPEAFEHGGKLVGIMVTLGFAVAFTIHLLEV